jgi:hypothetical protein
MKKTGTPARTLAQVNKALQKEIHPEIMIAKSEGCFYVTSDEEELGLKLSGLECTTIYVNSLNHLTVDEWVREVKRIFNQIDWGRNRLVCMDCKTEIFTDVNMVMIKDELWLSIADEKDALCDKCMEKRLKRPITPDDFGEQYKNALCNIWWMEEKAGVAEEDKTPDPAAAAMAVHEWNAHYTVGDPQTPTGVNYHTHGFVESFNHPDIQIVLNVLRRVRTILIFLVTVIRFA